MATYNHAAQARSASGINIVLGCWLIASPWIFGYTVNTSAFWNSIAAGILIALLALSRSSSPRGFTGASWLNLLLGLWVIASPWIYGYAANISAMWDCVAVGIVVALLAMWSGRATSVHNRSQTPTMTAVH